MNDSEKKLKVTLKKSVIGTIRSHRACVKGLGLRRLRHTVLIANTPQNLGMVKTVNYLVQYELV